MRIKSYTNTDDLPEFSLYELELLEDRADKSGYWLDCHVFVEGFMMMSEERRLNLSDKQVEWLWRIKADL